MFRPVFVNARDLDDCWFQLLFELYKNGRKYKITEGSYKGRYRLVFDFVSGFINYPHTRPLSPQIPENCPLPPPTTDEEIEQYFINYLMDSKLAKNEHYRYSTWIVGGRYKIPPISSKYLDSSIDHPSWEIIVPNQIQWIIDHFKSRGFGNEHCYLVVGYPESSFGYDISYSNPNERMTSPCLRGLDFRVVEDEGEYYLLTHIIYRSWDLIAGFPTNMGGFALLNEYVAFELGINPGALSFSCKSLHCYDFHMDYLKSRLGVGLDM